MSPITPSRLLVVDASVARAAAPARDLRASRCCQVLRDILSICHHVAFSPPIRDEWHRHRSGFVASWLPAMIARRKMALGIEPRPLLWPPRPISGLARDEEEALRKDMHLIEAACAGDGIIVTLDQRLERLWEKYGHHLQPPCAIRWINPERDGLPDLRAL